jgi:hypothetical protein
MNSQGPLIWNDITKTFTHLPRCEIGSGATIASVIWHVTLSIGKIPIETTFAITIEKILGLQDPSKLFPRKKGSLHSSDGNQNEISILLGGVVQNVLQE